MQHRKVYLDDWCLMEKVCLASAVLQCGENWSSVCELLKPRLRDNRPWDWFTPETCETQYKVLYNEFVKPQNNGESPVLQIIQNLKTQCRLEGQRKEEHWNKYMTVKKKLENLLKNDLESELIEKYYEEIQREKKEREENLRRHHEELKKRELLKYEFEKTTANTTPNKQETKADGGSSPLVTSPLLSSLLNNPPAVQYRPTLSTSSFIPAKASQGTSRSSSFEKVQSYSDTAFKDSFTHELSDQLSTPERLLTPVASSSSAAIKKLDFQENISSPAAGSRTPISESSSRIQTISAESTPRSDPHNLDSFGLISPSEEVANYLSEVDIPPETILEVIGDLKDGHISIDKIIQDLEANGDGEIMKEDLTGVSVPLGQSYIIDTKPIDQIPVMTQPQPILEPIEDIKPEITNECKLEVNEIQVQPFEPQSTEAEKLPEIEEQVVMVEDSDKEEQDTRICETDDIANIEINSSDGNLEIPMIKDESPVSSVSFSSTVAISVELESSFSEQKSDNETSEPQTNKYISTKSSESEVEDDPKVKYSKPVVVIKRIEDSGVHYLNKTRRSKAKILLEESIKEEPTLELEQIPDQVKEPHQVLETKPEVPAKEEPIAQLETIQESDKEAEKLMDTVDENVTIEENANSKQTKETVDEEEHQEKPVPSIADDSDTSDKFEDALQTPHEETIGNQTADNIANIEIEEKSSSYTEVDESFNLNLSEDNPEETTIVEETPPETEQQANTHEQPIEEKSPEDVVIRTETTNQPTETESIENAPTVESVNEVLERESTTAGEENDDVSQKAIEEVRQSEDVRPAPTKIIKKYGRKRKNTSESNDSISEMSIKIAPVVLQEIETLDSDIEQTFTPVHNIKIEPSDSKPLEEKKEQKDETVSNERPRTRENTPAKVKQERRDNKTPERPVVKVLRRNSGKPQSPLRKTERESRSMDNSELVKTRRKSILLAYTRLTSHKYSNAFQKPITNKQVPGYDTVIYKPMDLYTIKKKIDNKQISSVAEFQKDVLLMLNNAKMFNRINSQVYNMAVELEEDALPSIQLTVETLGEGVLRLEAQNREKIRKRQSLEKKDAKLKRMKSKDDSFSGLPLKKPKLEENDDD